MDSPVLLTVRGTLNPKSIDDARKLHNETAGSPQGMEVARSLSDLSHCVFVAAGDGNVSEAGKNELLFLDTWADPAGLTQFFSAKEVHDSASKLFAQRDGSVWMEGRGAFNFHVPATQKHPARFVGIFRGVVDSPEAGIEAFNKMVARNLRLSRKRGHLSHDVYVRMGAPSDPIEVLGVDFWCTLDGMLEHYMDKTAMTGMADVLKAPPVTSIWEQAVGFNEW